MNTAACLPLVSPYYVCDTQINPSSSILSFLPKCIPSSPATLSGVPHLSRHYLFTVMLQLKGAFILGALFVHTVAIL